LLESEIPSHSHQVFAGPVQFAGNTNIAVGNAFAKSGQGNAYTAAANLVMMASAALPPAGGDQPHNNMQPFLTFYFNIALQGVYPPRT